MKFATRNDRNRIQQTFDKEKIFVDKCGEKINCFDAIQEANVDTDIYEVMKKYHCEVDAAAEFMKTKGEKGFYADIVELQKEIQDIGDIQRVSQKAQQMFEALPIEIKQKYGQDLNLFLEEQKKKAIASTEPKQTTEVNKQEVNNETK